MRTIVVMIALSVLSATAMRLHAAESSSSTEAESPSSPAAESPSFAEPESSSFAAAPAIKLSRDGICHDAASQYYSKLKEYQGFDSMNSCIAAGGLQRSTAKARNTPTQDTFSTGRERSWIDRMVSGLKELNIIWLLLAGTVGLWLLVISLRSSSQRWRNRWRIEPFLPASASPPTEWGLELLHAMEWHRLEILAATYFERLGFKAKLTSFGPDGGVDIELIPQQENAPAILVQCKAWVNQPVGVKEARELLGIMAHRKVSEGV